MGRTRDELLDKLVHMMEENKFTTKPSNEQVRTTLGITTYESNKFAVYFGSLDRAIDTAWSAYRSKNGLTTKMSIVRRGNNPGNNGMQNSFATYTPEVVKPVAKPPVIEDKPKSGSGLESVPEVEPKSESGPATRLVSKQKQKRVKSKKTEQPKEEQPKVELAKVESITQPEPVIAEEKVSEPVKVEETKPEPVKTEPAKVELEPGGGAGIDSSEVTVVPDGDGFIKVEVLMTFRLPQGSDGEVLLRILPNKS